MWYPGRRLGGRTRTPADDAPGSLAIRRPLLALALVATVLLSMPVVAAARQSATPQERMAALVNRARIAQGLNPVAISPELTAAAEAHSRDMAASGYMEHRARDGSTPQQRAVRNGYAVPQGTAWIVVEVISARPTPEAAADWLLTDRLHRGVMLRPAWREMGIGYVKGGPYGQFWTIDFGCRPNVLPVLTEAAPSGGMTVRLTNEDCAPGGGNADQIGRATEMMVSDRKDFRGAVWEPFSATKSLPNVGDVHVKLRDGRGREATSLARKPGGDVAAAMTSPAAPIPTSAGASLGTPPQAR
jgi:uncharacterized protein YkwD